MPVLQNLVRCGDFELLGNTHREDRTMRVNPLLLGLGLLLVVVVIIGAIRLGGNLDRSEGQKQFPPHAVQQQETSSQVRAFRLLSVTLSDNECCA